jgi:hypothetical protein
MSQLGAVGSYNIGARSMGKVVRKEGSMTLRVLIPAALVALATAIAAPLALSAPGSPPTTVTASKLSADRSPFLPAGRVVSDATLTNRVYVNRRDGFSLSWQPNAQYGACTTDAGHTWRICTPVLHVSAANAPNVVTGADHWTYRVYGGPGGGASVVVSNDAAGAGIAPTCPAFRWPSRSQTSASCAS